MKVKIDNIYPDLEFRTFSERIQIFFDKTHPLYGHHFMTKYYTFIHDNTVIWGYDNKKLKWEKI
tara:strand:+ start:464 stop:655 length:192 start_codon:yes stop_codon:yes gene_type:complete